MIGPEDASSAEALRRRARFGIVLLAGRTAVVQVGVLVGQVVMARLLDPADFGLYAICAFALSFFAFFGDGGLGGALIQKQEAPTAAELSTAFWASIAIALSV